MTHIVLLKPHTHAGKAFLAGASLALPAATAHWLIQRGIALEGEPKATRQKAVKPAKPKLQEDHHGE